MTSSLLGACYCRWKSLFGRLEEILYTADSANPPSSSMKRSATASSSAPPAAKRQQSLAGFFVKPEKKLRLDDELDAKPLPRALDDPVSKRATDPSPPKQVQTESLLPYPPSDHQSYHPPPTPTFNHPFPIPPIPDSLNLMFNTAPHPTLRPDLGLDLLYFKRFIDPSCSWDLTNYLLSALPWQRVKYTLRGNSINTPRWTTVFGKDATNTSWRGYKCRPRAIPPILLRLMQKGMPLFPSPP